MRQVMHHQFNSFVQSCPTLCKPMDWSTPIFPAHHQLPELTQTHVHQVKDAIQPSHHLSSPSPPTFNLSQYMHHRPTQPVALKTRSCPWPPICLLPFIARNWVFFVCLFVSRSLVKRPAYTQGDKKYTSELTLLFPPEIILMNDPKKMMYQ